MQSNKPLKEKLVELLFDGNDLRPEALSLVPDEVKEDDPKSYLLNTLAPLQLPVEFIAENAESYSKRLLVVEGHIEDIIVSSDYKGFADMIIDIYLEDEFSELDQYIIASIFDDTYVSEFVKVNLASEILSRTYSKIGLVGSGKIDVGEHRDEYLQALLKAYEDLFAAYGAILIKGYEEDMIQYESLQAAYMDWAWILVSTVASHIEIPLDVCTRLNDAVVGFAVTKIDDLSMVRKAIEIYEESVERTKLTGGYAGTEAKISPVPPKVLSASSEDETKPNSTEPDLHHEEVEEAKEEETEKDPSDFDSKDVEEAVKGLPEPKGISQEIIDAIKEEPVTSATILVLNDSTSAKILFEEIVPKAFPHNNKAKKLTYKENMDLVNDDIINKNDIVLLTIHGVPNRKTLHKINTMANLLDAVVIISSNASPTNYNKYADAMSVVYLSDMLVKNRLEDKVTLPETIIDSTITSTSILVLNDHAVAEKIFTDLAHDLFPKNDSYSVLNYTEDTNLYEAIVKHSVTLINVPDGQPADVFHMFNVVAKATQSVIIISTSSTPEDRFQISEPVDVVYNGNDITKNRLGDAVKFPKYIKTNPEVRVVYDADLVTEHYHTNNDIKFSEDDLQDIHELGSILASILRRDYIEVLDRDVVFELSADDENQFYINDDQIVFILNVPLIKDQLIDNEDISELADEYLDNLDVILSNSLGIHTNGRNRIIAEPVSEEGNMEALKEELFRVTNGRVSFADMKNLTEDELIYQIIHAKQRIAKIAEHDPSSKQMVTRMAEFILEDKSELIEELVRVTKGKVSISDVKDYSKAQLDYMIMVSKELNRATVKYDINTLLKICKRRLVYLITTTPFNKNTDDYYKDHSFEELFEIMVNYTGSFKRPIGGEEQ